jgi:hypothetical protein
MPKSKAHKYWNKVRGWALRAGEVKAEESRGLEEFFVNPNRIPQEQRHLAMGLFIDWFLFDRKLTSSRLTPLELFIRVRQKEKKIKEEDLAIYRRFHETNRFGVFKIEDISPGEWIDVKAISGGEILRIFEEQGTQGFKRGDYFISRLLAYEDHWAMSVATLAFPDKSRYIFDRTFSEEGKTPSSDGLRPRDALRLFMPKIDWEKEGLVQVRARLASILQRLNIDIQVSQIEENIKDAHAKKLTESRLVQDVLKRMPRNSDLQEASELCGAIWNMTIAECDPSIDLRMLRNGPIERMLLHDMQRMIQRNFVNTGSLNPNSADPVIRDAIGKWLNEAQQELGGKTPREAILQERKALGNPQEDVGYEISVKTIEASPSEQEAYQSLEKADKALTGGRAEQAIPLYQDAYQHLKGYPDSHKILGNWATAHAMLGDRDKALELLRNSLKINPDYQVARDHLHLLESMSPDEFERQRRCGLFGKMKS